MSNENEQIEILDPEVIEILTPEQMAEYLQYLHLSGLTMKECAKVFSCDVDCVFNFFRNERIYYPEEIEVQTQEWKEEYILFLYSIGKPLISISGFMKIERYNIERFLYKYGSKYCLHCHELHPFEDFRKGHQNQNFQLSTLCKKAIHELKFKDQTPITLYNEYMSKITCIHDFSGYLGYGWNSPLKIINILKSVDPNIKIYKQCYSHCNQIKDLNDFYGLLKSSTKTQPLCKKCADYYNKIYYALNLESIKEQKQVYNSLNLENRRIREREKYNSNIDIRLSHSISTQIKNSLYNGKESNGWKILVDYSLNELKEHLENQFDENMMWINYGTYWNIDHIVPKAFFKITSYKDLSFKLCWSLENLQPLEKQKKFYKK